MYSLSLNSCRVSEVKNIVHMWKRLLLLLTLANKVISKSGWMFGLLFVLLLVDHWVDSLLIDIVILLGGYVIVFSFNQ